MQAIIGPPRQALTEAQVIEIIQGSSALTVSAGMEMIDMGLNFLEDISNDLEGGSITRGSFNNLHASCDLRISKTDINWPNALGRPYMVLTADGISARFNLGAFFLASPQQEIETLPPIRTVIGYDILQALAELVGESYSVNAGASYLDAITTILIQRGYTKWVLDQQAAASVLPAAKVWPIDTQTTWLTIVNDLLGAIGYAGIWSDWDGQLRLQPYITPAQRNSEWTYGTGGQKAMIGPKRVIEDDFFNAPNRWVAVRQNNIEGVAPVEGNGIFTFNNYGVGKTSQVSRERVISKVFQIDAADQAALETTAQITIDADMRLVTKITATTSPNPLHWHFDRMFIQDDVMGELQVMGTEWRLSLDGSEMTHKWTVLS